ncbi:uncharacterized protein SPSK_10729 [Sporothrix schenckii 1099-18]|uniref:Uncharacterized protein n=1 Tax=Sporothrix schenckii 1099-18 TaxID=1397361 RepID=A0A0F2MKV0_SPOSC|nr:uncharacterized protein SPSK_10729 [Sporothrix schenckii 1099-18]KJR89689.1 hypothetical protein SPSK_10729 [Sporothrix schenckii 1099-18]
MDLGIATDHNREEKEGASMSMTKVHDETAHIVRLQVSASVGYTLADAASLSSAVTKRDPVRPPQVAHGETLEPVIASTATTNSDISRVFFCL